jgi:hypothetical protein
MSRPTFINKSSLPPEAFRCTDCSAVAGKCEHTDPKTHPRYRVVVAGIIEGRREPMNETLIMGPVTPMPMERPKSKLLALAFGRELPERGLGRDLNQQEEE